MGARQDRLGGVGANSAVIDLDEKTGEHGFRDFREAEGIDADQIETPIAVTPTGGRHLIFDAAGVKYKNGVRINGASIDTRTAGGYIILPRPGNGRRWLKPLTTPLARVPSWVPQAISIGREIIPSGKSTPYGRRALKSACNAIVSAPCGGQERTLVAQCYAIGGLVGGQLDFGLAVHWLTIAANQMPTYRDPWRGLPEKVRRSVEARDGAPAQRPRNPRENRNVRKPRMARFERTRASLAGSAST